MREGWALCVVGAGLVWAMACSGVDAMGIGAGGASGAGGAGPGSGGAAGTNDAGETDLATTPSKSVEPSAAGSVGFEEEAGAELCPEIGAKEPQTLDAVLGGAQSTGSATGAAEFLKSIRQSPRPADVRIQDFLNHYVPQFPATQTSEVAIHLQLRKAEIAPYFDLLVALQAPALEPRPVDVTVVLDNTASIGPTGLERARAALKKLVDSLREDDALHLLTATPDAAIETFTFQNNATLSPDSIQLAPEKEIYDLVQAGYGKAGQSSLADRVVVLISDGEGDPQRLLSSPDGSIRLAAIGTGPGLKFGHRLLRSASRVGNGPYVYLDSVERVAELDVERLYFSVANDVQLQVTLPWYFTFERPFTGNTATPGDVEAQYLGPSQVSVFLFRLVACDDSAPATVQESISASVTFTAAFPPPEAVTIPVPALLNSTHQQLDKTHAVLVYAEALRSLDDRRLKNALDVVTHTNAASPDPDLTAIAELLALHPALPQ
jgi:hypothetical protein